MLLDFRLSFDGCRVCLASDGVQGLGRKHHSESTFGVFDGVGALVEQMYCIPTYDSEYNQARESESSNSL